jgi:hypothetical protein
MFNNQEPHDENHNNASYNHNCTGMFNEAWFDRILKIQNNLFRRGSYLMKNKKSTFFSKSAKPAGECNRKLTFVSDNVSKFIF